jgi:hypothetical protein
LEQTEEKLLDLSDLTIPEELKTSSFFFASFANASAVSFPTSLWQFLVFLIEMVLPNPSKKDGKSTITPIQSKVQS